TLLPLTPPLLPYTTLFRSHSDSPGIRGLRLLNFYRKVHFLSALAGLAGYSSIAMLASAFESLLMELHEKQDLITPSTLQTIAYRSEEHTSELHHQIISYAA